MGAPAGVVRRAPEVPPAQAPGPLRAGAAGAVLRRVHRDRGEAQINVAEDEVLEQFGGPVDQITLTPELADQVARALNEGQRDAGAERARAAEIHRNEVAALQQKEDRLFDRYDAGEVDRETYDRQLARVRADKAESVERLHRAESAAGSTYLVTGARVLEMAKQAKSLWIGRSPEEKRDFVSQLVCNPRLEGRKVRYDLRNPSASSRVCAKVRDGVPSGIFSVRKSGLAAAFCGEPARAEAIAMTLTA